MRTTEIAAQLERFRGRVAGTDAERRAANWLAEELAQSGREATVEPFWCRPNWALAHGWHLALALAGSLISVASAPIGGALVLISLLSVLADELLGVSLGRRLTPERASQNVVATSRDRPTAAVRLIIASNYDAGRAALLYRDAIRRPVAWLKAAVRGITPGWLGWLAIANLWLLATAVVRATGEHSSTVGVAQLAPTVALLLGAALLIELILSEAGPAAGDNGSGVAVAMTLMRALDIAPPRHLDVELLLGGAGEGGQIGIRRHLQARRRELRASNAVVLGIAACSGGAPRWWSSDGALIPAHYTRLLRQLAASVAADETYLHVTSHMGRGMAPAWPARRRRLPALTIGCLDQKGLAPRSHQITDSAPALDEAAIENAVQLALILVDAIDVHLGRKAPRTATPA